MGDGRVFKFEVDQLGEIRLVLPGPHKYAMRGMP